MPTSAPPAAGSPIFVVGCDRSGTTLLRLILNASTRLHVVQESGFLDRLRANAPLYGDCTSARERWFLVRDLQTTAATSKTTSFDALGLAADDAERALADAAPTDFAGAATALFDASARAAGKSRWGDKTPRYVLDLPWLAEAFPTARFVHVIRDARDVVASMRKAGWHADCRAAAKHWVDRVRAGRDAGASLGADRYREVTFEALSTAPEATITALCDWLALPYEPAMLEFHRDAGSQLPNAHAELHWRTSTPVDASRAFAWRAQMRRRDVADVEQVAGALLTELDYPRTSHPVPLWLRCSRACLRAVLPLVERIRDRVRALGLS